MAIASYLFHVSKYIDLLDTFFMVVRGNKHQITVLHIFHHSSMILNSWMGVRHAPTGHSFFIHLANSFVHISMYSYYFLSSLGTWIRPYLWWKPLLTQMQIIQFFFMFIHMMFGFYNDCPLPMPLVKTVLIYLIVLICLFINFYVQTYLKDSRKLLKNKEY
ncbi:Elongation of very long chain fatty acids protein 5 [Armadillidium nasatum]|uniref:Elongation of very long chain fatty acids protein n=1 Tax=Armadillidium nasatum TaxID=96803 RepID=A0A5N5T9G7_9CRUS|nr:Elongation of very long chain fatty acids protein 5 [Armadillidium nasatum]